MSNDDFRRELNSTFDQVSGSPSPGLRDRIRSGIAQAPEARGPFWIATVAACVIAVLLVGVLFVANPLRRPSSSVGPGVPTASPSATPSPSPSTSPEPQLPAFVCASSVAGQHPSSEPVAFVSDLRSGTHAGYDRLTIDFSNGGPSGAVELKPQSGTTFTQSPSGMSVTTKGGSGILVVRCPAADFMSRAQINETYRGGSFRESLIVLQLFVCRQGRPYHVPALVRGRREGGKGAKHS